MNMTIFGGTGPAGQLTIKKALGLGHRVTAYARASAKINVQHDHLVIIRGELNEADKIAKAIAGADAVISLLGPNLKFKALEISTGYKNIVSAMEKMGPSVWSQPLRPVKGIRSTNISSWLNLVFGCYVPWLQKSSRKS